MHTLTQKAGGFTIFAAAVLLGPGTLIGFWIFLYTGPFEPISLALGLLGTLIVDGCLSLLFFLQHSIMVRRSFRQWLARFLPEAYYGPVYAISAGLALLMILVFWQETSVTIIRFTEPLSWVFRAGYFVSLFGFVWCIWALGLIDPFGLTPLVHHIMDTEPDDISFTIRGPYRWMRHPVYFFSILILWTHPHLTADRLLLNITWTAWILIATVLEERDLVDEFGHTYRRYQETIPMLIPWQGPRAGDSE